MITLRLNSRSHKPFEGFAQRINPQVTTDWSIKLGPNSDVVIPSLAQLSPGQRWGPPVRRPRRSGGSSRVAVG